MDSLLISRIAEYPQALLKTNISKLSPDIRPDIRAGLAPGSSTPEM